MSAAVTARAPRICATYRYSNAVSASPRALTMNRSSTAQHMVRQLVSPGNRPITFRPPLDLLQRPLQQVGRAEPPAEAQRVGEVHADQPSQRSLRWARLREFGETIAAGGDPARIVEQARELVDVLRDWRSGTKASARPGGSQWWRSTTSRWR
jgi:hypothetical protein